MGNFILRVDDVGWLPPEKTKDHGLKYFAKWRELLGLENKPAYYGAIPEMLDRDELIWIRQNLARVEELAVHGWDHAAGAIVTRQQMELARQEFASASVCTSYIAPFNKYNAKTVDDWSKACPNSYFFGGFAGQDHSYGELPTLVENTWHLAAFRPLYNHSAPLMAEIPKWADIDLPLVVTLHCTWAWDNLGLLPELGAALAPHLVKVDQVKKWNLDTRLDRRGLTAAHYLAYNWIYERTKMLPVGSRLLDFGARYSELPSKLSLRGLRVSVMDRDPAVEVYQRKIADRYKARVRVLPVRDIGAVSEKFDIVTCCWAVQHNLPAQEKIPQLARALASRLEVGGRLLVVSSYAHGPSFEQTDRADPQFVMNYKDHETLVIKPTGLKLVNTYYFRYEHGSDEGDNCKPNEANAICYELVKES